MNHIINDICNTIKFIENKLRGITLELFERNEIEAVINELMHTIKCTTKPPKTAEEIIADYLRWGDSKKLHG